MPLNFRTDQLNQDFCKEKKHEKGYHFGRIQLSFQVLFSVSERSQNRKTSAEFEL